MRAKALVREYFRPGFPIMNVGRVLQIIVDEANKEIKNKRPKTEEQLALIYSKYYQKWLDVCYTEGNSLSHDGYWRVLRTQIPRDHVDVLQRNRPEWAKDPDPLAEIT